MCSQSHGQVIRLGFFLQRAMLRFASSEEKELLSETEHGAGRGEVKTLHHCRLPTESGGENSSPVPRKPRIPSLHVM